MNREERLQALNDIEGQLSQYLAADKKNWIHTYLLMKLLLLPISAPPVYTL